LAPAAEMGACVTGVVVSERTVRRPTAGAGAASVAVQTAAVETIAQTLPSALEGPAVQLLSVDGALVPLQHQAWAEVNTLAMGTVGNPGREGDEGVGQTQELAYGSRLSAAEAFGPLALVATHRRGTETARTVCAVSDGAEWIQGGVALHRPDAVRHLDVPPALGEVAPAGQAVDGEGPGRFTPWFATQCQTLAYGNPEAGLGARRRWAAAAKRRRAVPAMATIHASLRYVEKRRDLRDAAWYQARGDPLGRGSVERANTLVVERRLQGAGRPWARAHVKPRVALRTVACSDRWAAAWPQIVQPVPQHAWPRRVPHQRCRRPPHPSPSWSSLPTPQALALPPAPSTGAALTPWRSSRPPPTRPNAPKAPYRPPPDHPWRRFRMGRARFQPPAAACGATR